RIASYLCACSSHFFRIESYAFEWASILVRKASYLRECSSAFSNRASFRFANSRERSTALSIRASLRFAKPSNRCRGELVRVPVFWARLLCVHPFVTKQLAADTTKNAIHFTKTGSLWTAV